MPLTGQVLDAVVEAGGHVPGQFWFEVLHGLARIVRRRELLRADVERFSRLLAELPIEIAGAYSAPEMIHLHELAGRLDLSIFDASYVDLALSRDLPLATKDPAMAAAMLRAGGRLFAP